MKTRNFALLALFSVFLLGQTPTIPPSAPSLELYQKYLEKAKQKPEEEKYRTPEIFVPETLGLKQAKKVEEEKVLVPKVEEPPFFNEYVVVENETVQVITKASPRELKVFGSELFEKEEGEGKGFLGLGDESTSKDYRLGAGDRIILRLWGDVNLEEELTIDREGNIFIPKAGTIAASGYTIEEFKEKLRSFLKKIYSNFEIDLTVGRVKLIKVYVVGEVVKPGSYVLSGLATALNAIDAAGGPTEKGSFRNISIYRGGNPVATLDIYELIRKGRAKGNVQLSSNDVVFVPPSGPQVKLRGQVKHPAIYEIKETENAFDLIGFAGGTLPSAYLDKIMVDRIRDGKRVIVDFSLRDTANAKEFKLYDGDDISVFPLPGVRVKLISVSGQVVRPGAFELRDSMRVSDIIKQVGLLPDAYLERADIIRITPNRAREIISFSPKKIIEGDTLGDLFLQSEDKLIFYSVWDVERKKYVRIDGAVKHPGEYELYENMRLSDLIFTAGGLNREADLTRVEIARLIPGKPAEIIYADLDRIINKGEKELDIPLMEDDRIFVRSIPGWKLQEIVTIEGEVNFPGKYAIMQENEKLSSIIRRAGGFTKMAFLKGAVFIRPTIEKDIEQKDIRGVILGTQEAVMDTTGEIKMSPLIFSFNPKKLSRIIIDLEKIMSGDEKEDILVQSGDWIYIPPIPSGVNVVGSVASQGTIKYMPKQSVRYYIERAGGFTRNADTHEIRLLKANGKAFKVGLSYSGIEPGDAIIVPQRIKKETEWGKLMKDVVSIISGLATTIYILLKL